MEILKRLLDTHTQQLLICLFKRHPPHLWNGTWPMPQSTRKGLFSSRECANWHKWNLIFIVASVHCWLVGHKLLSGLKMTKCYHLKRYKSIYHPHVIPNPKDVYLSLKHKWRYFQRSLRDFCPSIESFENLIYIIKAIQIIMYFSTLYDEFIQKQMRFVLTHLVLAELLTNVSIIPNLNSE